MMRTDKNKCYGVLNETCILPDKYINPNDSRIEVVTFWNENIIEDRKCIFYLDSNPIYADYNHLSVIYMNIIHKRVVNIISKYIAYDDNYKYNSSCPYYQLPHTSFLYRNLRGETCL